MKIYTGTCGGNHEDLARINSLGMGMMISAESRNLYKKTPCAIDNGAFEAWRRGMPWSEKRFFDLLEKSYSHGISADFIVCPDIVAGGLDSLDWSMKWAPKLRPARLALAVQDGMAPKDIHKTYLRHFTHIFVGGSVEWKWQNAKTWVDFAHENGLLCHIGRCGTLDKLLYAFEIGADSVDSTSFVRHKSWHIIENFLAISSDSMPYPETITRGEIPK